MDHAIGFGAKVLEYTVEPIARQFGYLISYGGNVKQLKDEFQELVNDRDSLQRLVDEARRNDEEILPNVQNWLVKVDEIKRTVDTFYEEESQAKTDCSLRVCPNPCSRYWLSRKAKKILTPEVIKLKDGGNFNRISCPKPPVSKWVGASSTSFSRGNEAFQSRISTINMIMDALADPTVNKIGLYGLAGVGKSTLVGEVAKKALREKLFDNVAMVEVTENPDYKKIQKKIGETVSLRLDEESELIRAGRLCERLKQEKNLVILDDLWDRLDLDKIGIPLTIELERDKKEIQLTDDDMGCKLLLDDLGDRLDLDKTGIPLTVELEIDKKEIQLTDDYKGCKLLLISRNVEVLSNQMNCKKNIRLDVLSEKEAWEMFKEMSQVQVDSDPDLQSLATKVAEKCAGLPIAIVTVARRLRNKSRSEWRDALKQLQEPTLQDVTGLTKVVHSTIKLSYDYLESEELKAIFLFSSVFSNNFSPAELFYYCTGLDLFQGIYAMDGVRDRLKALITKLKASCLFLDGSSDFGIMMHDVFRDFALSILSKEKFALAVRYGMLPEWPANYQLESYIWICLHESELGMLPEKLCCPRLKLFYLNNKDHELRIPNSLFKELRELGFLHLSKVNLPSLPNSITHLTNLRTLCLHSCLLGDVSMIGELRNLRALSFWGSIIEQLPLELGQLTQLQSINLSNCSKLKVIPQNVISRLKMLEEMLLLESFNKWQDGRSNDEGRSNACLEELMDLPKLSTLDIHVPDASMLRKDLFSDRLKQFRILIGDVWDLTGAAPRTLKLKLNTSIHSETSGVKKLIDRVEYLFLDEVNGIKSVLYELNRAGFPHLKRLQIQNNSQIECIIKSRQVHAHDAFPMLETLVLENMNQLEKLCDGQLSVNSFSKLTVIRVRNCDKLNSLFPVFAVRSVLKLTEIEISGCKLMQEIVDLSDQKIDNGGILEFNQLRILRMSSLPALVGFCFNGERSLASDSNGITIEDQPNPFQHLFDEKVAFPSLDTLILSAMNIQNIWHESISASSWVQNLTDLSVEGCQSLRHIMPIAVARGFVKLKHLKICRCEMVEVIIFPTPNATHTSFSKEVILPSLETMVISHMENLQMIWNNHFAPNSYGNIKKMEISYCDKLVTIIPSHMLRTLSHLETLTVSNCGSLDTIFDVQCVNVEESLSKLAMQLRNLSLNSLPNLRHIWNNDSYSFVSFGSLQTVHVIRCECLRRIFSASMVISLVQLEQLKIQSCGIEEIVGNEGQAAADKSFVLPRIASLQLWWLSKLRRFYPGKYTLHCPELKVLNVIGCDKMELFEVESTTFIKESAHDLPVGQLEAQIQQPLFHFEKVIPHLETFALSGKDFSKICRRKFQEDLFHSIRTIMLQNFESKAVQFPYRFLHRMPNLQQLTVKFSSFKEIFPSRSLVAEEKQTAGVVRLTSLTLHRLPLLECICKGLQIDPVLEKLEYLYVWQCSGLTNLISTSASFNCLTLLEVSKCHGLVNLIAPSTAKSLVCLRKLIIKECKMLQEIVAKVGDVTEDKISFSCLEHLELVCLPSLVSFCAENYNFDFPRLEQVIVRQCPRMKIFSQGESNTPRLRNLQQEKDGENSWKGDLDSTIKLLFREKVAFRSMETIKLDEYPEVIDIWEGKLSNWPFSNLKSLIVENCDFLSYVIPSYVLHSLSNLEELEVLNCNSVEAVFDLQDIKEPHTLPQMRLKSMKLSRLQKLECVWNKDPQQSDFCQHLQKVKVLECGSLRSIFSASIAKNLPKLEALLIDICIGVEVIVERDEVTGAAPCFVFPQLSFLRLWRLPNLKNFYPECHTSEWPQLRQLRVRSCNNLDVFGTKVSSMTETERNDEDKIKYPLCLVEKVIPRLTALALNQKAIMKIMNGQFQDDLFHNVKFLILESFLDDHVAFPYSFLERFPNTEELYVYTSFFEELFPCQLPLGAHTRKIAPFKNLTLSYLKKLKNIWNEDHQEDQVLQNLESLKVTGCNALITLAPSSASFDNLTDLEVSGCHQLIYLITSSTAKTLVQLMRLKINDCKLMSEIVTDKEGNVGSTIAMQKLEYLELIGLSCLKAFCSSKNCTLVFPSLYQVIVRECPRLSMFCAGVLVNPILEGVEIEENGVCWDDNLNKTIENLFEEKVAFRSVEKLKLVEYPELIDIWEGKLSNWSFNNLKSLIMENCDFLSYAIPSYLLNCLSNLEELEVSNCNSMEAVLDLQDIKEPHTLPQLRLKSITLLHLPKLRSVWNKDPQQIEFCQQLQKVEAFQCESLRSIFPASMAKCLSKLEELRISGCSGVEVIVDMDEVAGVAPCFEFPQLHTLILWRLPNLKNFYPETHTSEWPRLRVLKVYMCKNVEVFGPEIPSTTETHEKDKLEARHPLFFVEKVAFPSLDTLILSAMNIQNIWHESISAGPWVQNLTDLSVEGCQSLRHIMPIDVARGFVKLKHLKICRCEMVEMIIFPTPNATNTSVSKEVMFPCLETMVISHMENLQMIWNNHFAPNSYGNVKKMEISYCDKLVTIIPSHMVRTLNHLETLTVSHCGSLDTIFDIQCVKVEESHNKLAMQLRNLSLDSLSNLRHIWNNDSYSFVSFGSLQTVHVIRCECLRRIFSASMVISLVQLEQLKIQSCGIEEIVGNEGQAAADISFVLPRIASLQLWWLSKLRRFYPGKYTLHCPELKVLDVIGCDKMELFEVESTTFIKESAHDLPVGQLEAQIQQPLFHFEKVIPHLETFALSGKDFSKICRRKFQEDLFHSIRTIMLQNFESKAVQFPYRFLHRMPNLQQLTVKFSSFKEIFPSRSLVAEEKQTAGVVRLTSLTLHRLPLLECICKGLQIDPVLEKLEYLYVWQCSGLTNLISTSASFNCLTLLEVSKCHGLVNLIAPSTAKSLVCLRKLRIKECKMLQEIVAKVGDVTEDKISFSCLEHLQLVFLPSLVSSVQRITTLISHV